MKAVMYHYVRERPKELPFFRYLHIEDFRKQLDHFDGTDRFVTKDEFLSVLNGDKAVPDDGIILTFDDALKDHYTYVTRELYQRGLWGLFYIPTSMYQTGKMLDVHRIHYLIGRYGGEDILAWLSENVDPEMVQNDKRSDFQETTYKYQDNDAATTEVKRLLNYYLSYDHREKVLDDLMSAKGDESSLVKDYYLSTNEMKEMCDLGMVLGSHTVNHPVLSRLTIEQQRNEIADSFNFLEGVVGTGPFKTFCYPYGRSSTYTVQTQEILSAEGCMFSFAVDHRDITDHDVADKVQALPRWDCNQFPHGQARQG